jgi:hypothetical protein
MNLLADYHEVRYLVIDIVSNNRNMRGNNHMVANFPTNASRAVATPSEFHVFHPTTNAGDRSLQPGMRW